MDDKKQEVKTKFKGPGQWRTQAARLEGSKPKPEEKSSQN